LVAATRPSVPLAGRFAQDRGFGAASDGRSGPGHRPAIASSRRGSEQVRMRDGRIPCRRDRARLPYRSPDSRHFARFSKALSESQEGLQTWSWRFARTRPQLQQGIGAGDERILKSKSTCRTSEPNPRSRLDSVASVSSSTTPGSSQVGQRAGVRSEKARRDSGFDASNRLSLPAQRGHVDQVVAPFASSADSGLIGRRLTAANACEFRAPAPISDRTHRAALTIRAYRAARSGCSPEYRSVIGGGPLQEGPSRRDLRSRWLRLARGLAP
jgi:hypothetical protein